MNALKANTIVATWNNQTMTLNATNYEDAEWELLMAAYNGEWDAPTHGTYQFKLTQYNAVTGCYDPAGEVLVVRYAGEFMIPQD